MSTVVLGEQPQITPWLEQRRALGQDGRDEVWEGVYHVAPLEHSRNGVVAVEIQTVLHRSARDHGLRGVGPFNLGVQDDLRVPDGGWLRRDAALALYLPTAAAVLEVLSPDDETYAKLGFYAAHGVSEVLIAHPVERWVQVHAGPTMQPATWSDTFETATSALEAAVDWP